MARFPQRPLSELSADAQSPTVDACPYGTCDGSGWVEDLEARTARPCDCREQIVLKRRVGSLNQRIPRKYRDLGWDRNPVPEIAATNPLAARSVRTYCNRIDEHVAAGEGLWLWGRKGTGKTTLAYIVSQTAIAAGHTVAIYTGPALLNALRDTYRDDSPISTLELIERLSHVDLLHLEDLAVARPTEWVLEQLYTIVNNRYDERRSMVFTSDAQIAEADEHPELNPMRLAEAVGDRTLSRLIEMCGDALPMLGDDKRMRFGAAPADALADRAASAIAR